MTFTFLDIVLLVLLIAVACYGFAALPARGLGIVGLVLAAALVLVRIL